MCVCVCVFVCMCVCICIIIKTCDKISSSDTSSKQLTRSYKTINKKTNQKNIQAIQPDQYCWGARAKMTVLKSSKQSLWSSTDEPYHLSHYI